VYATDRTGTELATSVVEIKSGVRYRQNRNRVDYLGNRDQKRCTLLAPQKAPLGRSSMKTSKNFEIFVAGTTGTELATSVVGSRDR